MFIMGRPAAQGSPLESLPRVAMPGVSYARCTARGVAAAMSMPGGFALVEVAWRQICLAPGVGRRAAADAGLSSCEVGRRPG